MNLVSLTNGHRSGKTTCLSVREYLDTCVVGAGLVTPAGILWRHYKMCGGPAGKSSFMKELFFSRGIYVRYLSGRPFVHGIAPALL